MAVSGLRQNNERAVLSVVAALPGSSAAQIARSTGLGAQSVSRILTELENVGLVRRGEVIRGQRGQPAVPIFLDPAGAYCIGGEIGWRHFHVVLINLGGEILGEHRRSYDYPDSSAILPELVSIIQLLTGLVPDAHRARLLGAGLAMPSGLHRNAGLVGAPPEVAEHWKSMDLHAEVGEATGLDIFAFNDGNAGCWAELAALPSPRPSNLAYLQVGTFVGAGLIAQGRLWEGPTGNSANLGSMVVRGSNDQLAPAHLTASLYAFDQRLKAVGQSLPSGNPLDWDWTEFEPVLSEWIADASKSLAHVIMNTSAVMEFDTAIVDGVMPTPVVERLVQAIVDQVAAFPTLTSDRPEIRLGSRGSGAAAFGAALKPMFRRLFSRETTDIAD